MSWKHRSYFTRIVSPFLFDWGFWLGWQVGRHYINVVRRERRKVCLVSVNKEDAHLVPSRISGSNRIHALRTGWHPCGPRGRSSRLWLQVNTSGGHSLETVSFFSVSGEIIRLSFIQKTGCSRNGTNSLPEVLVCQLHEAFWNRGMCQASVPRPSLLQTPDIRTNRMWVWVRCFLHQNSKSARYACAI